MTRWIKVLLVFSVGLLILSYPACQLAEQQVQTEMAKYQADMVVVHPSNFIFFGGIWMFSSGSLLAVLSIVFWIVERTRR